MTELTNTSTRRLQALWLLSYLLPVTLHHTVTMHAHTDTGKDLGTYTATIPIRIRKGKIKNQKPKPKTRNTPKGRGVKSPRTGERSPRRG